MTATTDHDTRMLLAVQRAVVGLTIDDWGTHAWVFNHRVLASAQLSLLDLSREEQATLAKAYTRMRTYYEALNAIEAKTGVRNQPLAHLIVAMYYEVRSQTITPR